MDWVFRLRDGSAQQDGSLQRPGHGRHFQLSRSRPAAPWRELGRLHVAPGGVSLGATNPGWWLPLYSRAKNSATRPSLAMILNAYESPRKDLSHAQIFMSKLELAAFCRAFEFLDCERVIRDNPLYSRAKNSAIRTRLAMILNEPKP